MTRRILLIVAISLVVCLSVPAAALYWLCYTEAGLQWIAARVAHLRTVEIRIDGLHGRLTGPLSIERFELTHERVHFIAHDIKVDVKLHSVLLQTLQVEYIRIGSAAAEIKRRTSPASTRPPRFLPPWLRVRADAVRIDTARVVLINGRELLANRVTLAATLGTQRLTLERALVEADKFRLAGTLTVKAGDPVGLNGQIDWLVRLPDQPQLAGRVRLDGNLDRLAAVGSMTKPVQASFTGTGLDLTSQWHWEAQSQGSALDLKPWLPKAKFGPFAGTFKAGGDNNGFHVSGTVEPAQFKTGPIDLSFLGSFAERRLHADELKLRFRNTGGELLATGELAFLGGPPAAQVEAQWRNLAWPIGQPVIISARGDLKLQGTIPYTYSLNAQTAGPRLPPAQIAAQGTIDRERLTLASFVARLLDGTITGNGEWSWADAQRWQLAFNARRLNPAALNNAFPGNLSFRVAARGHEFDAGGDWHVELAALRGRLRAQPVTGQGIVSRNEQTLRVSNLQLHFGNASLEANGYYGVQRDLSWLLRSEDLARALPEARGKLEFKGRLGGTEQEPKLAASLKTENLEYRRFLITALQADADLDISDQRASWLRLTASGLGFGERKIASLSLNLDGRARDHDATLRVDAGNVQIELLTHAGYERELWQGQLSRLSIAAGTTHVAMVSPTHFAVGRQRAVLDPFCLVGDQERACGSGQWQKGGAWQFDLQATGLPLRLLAAGLPQPSEYAGQLDVQAKAGGQPGSPWTGAATLDFSGGVFRYERTNGKIESLSIGTGRAQFNAEPEHYTATLRLQAGEAARIQADVTADRQASEDWRALPLSGSVHAETSQLGFVPVLLPEVDRASGELKADLRLSGTLGAPQFDGALQLSNGSMDLYAINLLLRDIGLRVGLAGNTLKLTGQAKAGPGSAAIDGDLSWNAGAPHGTLKFKGQNLELVNVPEARVQASPDLNFKIEGRNIAVDGSVLIPSARLAPADLSGAVLPSEDEVIVGSQPVGAEQRFRVTTAIHLLLGDDVRIDSYGLTGRITGGVTAYSDTGEVSTGTGELKIEEGEYVAYTRELDIERGRLVFTGGPLADPGVDIRATKQFPEVLAGVNVRGTLRNPRISFFSDPPLPQTQIVSLLVAGGTLDSFQDRAAQGSGQTREQLLAQGGALLARQLGGQLGIEEVNVESNSNNETSLVLGRYLSPRLYVSYGISLTESINTLKLRYTIDDRWTLKTEAGENRSADVVFTIQR